MALEEFDELAARILQVNTLRWQAMMTCDSSDAGRAEALHLTTYGSAVQDVIDILQYGVQGRTTEAYNTLLEQEDALRYIIKANQKSFG